MLETENTGWEWDGRDGRGVTLEREEESSADIVRRERNLTESLTEKIQCPCSDTMKVRNAGCLWCILLTIYINIQITEYA